MKAHKFSWTFWLHLKSTMVLTADNALNALFYNNLFLGQCWGSRTFDSSEYNPRMNDHLMTNLLATIWTDNLLRIPLPQSLSKKITFFFFFGYI